jgi:hypothetical protein
MYLVPFFAGQNEISGRRNCLFEARGVTVGFLSAIRSEFESVETNEVEPRIA